MSKRRARYSAQFKFQLALEAVKGLKTINELASEHGVHPTQISEWKRQLLDAGDTLFNRDGARHGVDEFFCSKEGKPSVAAVEGSAPRSVCLDMMGTPDRSISIEPHPGCPQSILSLA